MKSEQPTTKTEPSSDPQGATPGSASSSGQHGWGKQTQWTDANQSWWQTWSWSKWSWKYTPRFLRLQETAHVRHLSSLTHRSMHQPSHTH